MVVLIDATEISVGILEMGLEEAAMTQERDCEK